MDKDTKKLIEYIDLIAKWLLQHPSKNLPTEFKTKARFVLNAIIDRKINHEINTENHSSRIKNLPVEKKQKRKLLCKVCLKSIPEENMTLHLKSHQTTPKKVLKKVSSKNKSKTYIKFISSGFESNRRKH